MEQHYHTSVMSLNLGYSILGFSVLDVMRDSLIKMYGVLGFSNTNLNRYQYLKESGR
jgi:hypothetical protein